MARLFGILATACVVLCPFALLWLAVFSVFGSESQPVAVTLALSILFGLPTATLLVYRHGQRLRHD